MANEAVRLVALGTSPANPINFGISDGAQGGVEKGSLMKMSGAYLVAGGLCAIGSVWAGIANTEKVAGDGSVTIGVDTCGIYDCLVDGNGTGVFVGDKLILSGTNRLVPAKIGALSGASYFINGCIAGKALEAVAIGATDTIAVAIGVD